MQSEKIIVPEAPATGDIKDSELWQIAKIRAGFKISAFSYVAVNCMLIAIWYLTSGPASYFWPVWPILGWGIGLALQYFHAYHGNNLFSVTREYEKLKNKQL